MSDQLNTPESIFAIFAERGPEENARTIDLRHQLLEITIQERREVTKHQYEHGPVYSKVIVNADTRPAKGKANKNAFVIFALPNPQ